MIFRIFYKTHPMQEEFEHVSYETYQDDDLAKAKLEAETHAHYLIAHNVDWARIYIREMTMLKDFMVYDLDFGWLEGAEVRDVVAYEYLAGNTNKYIKKFEDKDKRMLILNAKLQGEAGEFSDALGKMYRDYGGKYPGKFTQELILELGDIVWYITALAQELGYSLQEVLLLNILKLEKRYKENEKETSTTDNSDWDNESFIISES